MLDGVQFGYLVSRVANRHAVGGQWTLSRAIGEARPQLEAVEREQGVEFGELVRERGRQRGLPFPIAEKVLPFRPPVRNEATPTAEPTANPDPDEPQGRVDLGNVPAEARVAAAWHRLAAAELAGSSRRELEALEAAYHAEVATYRAARGPAASKSTCT